MQRPRGFPPFWRILCWPIVQFHVSFLKLDRYQLHDRSSILFVDHVRLRSTDHSPLSPSLSLSISARNGFEVAAIRRNFKFIAGLSLARLGNLYACICTTSSTKKSTSSLFFVYVLPLYIPSVISFTYVSNTFAWKGKKMMTGLSSLNRKLERFLNIIPRFLGSTDRCCLTPFTKIRSKR